MNHGLETLSLIFIMIYIYKLFQKSFVLGTILNLDEEIHADVDLLKCVLI